MVKSEVLWSQIVPWLVPHQKRKTTGNREQRYIVVNRCPFNDSACNLYYCLIALGTLELVYSLI